jgi:hypothetical protein
VHRYTAAKGAPPDLNEEKLKSEAKKYFMKKYESDILKAFPKMGKAGGVQVESS